MTEDSLPPNTKNAGIPKESSGTSSRGEPAATAEHLKLRAALRRAADVPEPMPAEMDEKVELEPFSVQSQVSGFCIAILMLVMFIPGGQTSALLPPWQQLFMPGSTTFIAGIVGLFLLSLQFRPMDAHSRAGWFVIVGILLSVFGFLAADAAVAGNQFGGQPAVRAILAGGVAPAIALTLGIVPLLAALFWRSQDLNGRGARGAVVLATSLTLFMYLGGHWVGLASDVPFTLILDAMESAVFLGDRVAAGLALLPIALCALSPICLMDRPSAQRINALAAMLYWTAAVLPGSVLALFVANSSSWHLVLEPIKVALLISTGFLLLGLGIGLFMASSERLKHSGLHP
jgi:hypothetical protein